MLDNVSDTIETVTDTAASAARYIPSLMNHVRNNMRWGFCDGVHDVARFGTAGLVLASTAGIAYGTFRGTKRIYNWARSEKAEAPTKAPKADKSRFSFKKPTEQGDTDKVAA